MNGIILYQSKYGATKKYADWLSIETGFECVETKKVSIKEVEKYDIVVFGGGLYASGIAGLSFLKKNIDKLHKKKIIVFFCCASPYDETAMEQIRSHNMKDKLSDIPIFYCRGAWDMDSMSFKDRTLCNLLRKAIAKKDPADYELWEKAIMEAGESKCDWTDVKYIEPILECIKRYC
jgi:menaquinone-dependent protoporphyrinogen IX oxidase